jgi:signal transduction histidine kinase
MAPPGRAVVCLKADDAGSVAAYAPIMCTPLLRQRLGTAHWLLVDGALALLYAVFAFGVLGANLAPVALGVAATVIAGLALVAARWFPWPATIGPIVLFWLSPVQVRFAWIGALPLAYALYRIAERRPRRAAVLALAAGLTGPAATALPSGHHAGGVMPFALFLIAAWTAGVAVRQHAQHTAGLLEREVGVERIRIARELHDVMAHSLSVITVQAAFGRLVADRQPDKAAGALAVIETTGRETLAELRRVLDLLRGDEPASADPAPGLAALDRLVEQTAAAGVTVRVTIQGEERPLPAGLQLSAYRVMQEALTNVVKHAGTDRASVLVAYEPDALVLDIRDEGRGGSIEAGGHGLIGMRERVALYGGTLVAGPQPGLGFAVHARLPVAALP